MGIHIGKLIDKLGHMHELSQKQHPTLNPEEEELGRRGGSRGIREGTGEKG